MAKTINFLTLEEAKNLYPEINNKYSINILKGTQYNELTVIYRTTSTKGRVAQYICKCSCGKFCLVSRNNLIKGNTKSCGHLRGQYREDLTQYKYGKLKPIYSEEKNNRIYWFCNCDCGGFTWVKASHLKDNSIQSCGCIKSKGEEKISKILAENNINFEKQYTFSNCIFPNTNRKALFDFGVIFNNQLQYLIEYDGIQHFEYKENNNGWNNINNFYNNQLRDDFKNKWCIKNNIPLIRIPYTHLKDLNIKDLQLETSNFIVKE